MNYTIVRSHRRTMAIQIKRDGRVVVRAPYAATDEEVRQLVEKQRAWIEKSLARQREAPAASPPELTEQEMEELRRRGQEILPGRVVYWAARMDVLPTGIRITAARTRWGSCSGKNSLCFSLFLMRYPMEAIDAVVVHELAHIRHKNHGPDFYRLVEGTLPDYRQRIGLLKLPPSGSLCILIEAAFSYCVHQENVI